MVSWRPINLKRFPVDQKWFPGTYSFKKVFRGPEMVSRQPSNLKKFSVDQKWFPVNLSI